MAQTGAETIRLRIGASRKELLRAVRPEAREKVYNSGFFPILMIIAVLVPIVLHFVAAWAEHRMQIPYFAGMPIMVLLYLPVPLSLHNKLIHDACMAILLREGVVLCGQCKADLRRFTWDTTLDPVCPECGRPFTRDKLEILLTR